MFFDAHLDLGYFVYWKRHFGETHVMDRYYLDEFRRGGLKLVIAAIYIDTVFLPDMGLKMALRECDALREEIADSPQHYRLITNRADLESLMEDDRIGIVLSLEGLGPIGDDLQMLSVFQRLGVRGIGMAWSRRNAALDGVGTFSRQERGGLTRFGEEVIAFAESHQMFIDVSHANDAAVYDILATVKKPVMASHSNPRALYAIERNLSDDMIGKILLSGGFVGVNGYNKNMASTDEELDMTRYKAHLEYFDRIGGGGVGLGFDMIGKLEMIPQLRVENPSARKGFDVIPDHGAVPEIRKQLEHAGWGESRIDGVMWRNLYDYLKRIW